VGTPEARLGRPGAASAPSRTTVLGGHGIAPGIEPPCSPGSHLIGVHVFEQAFAQRELVRVAMIAYDDPDWRELLGDQCVEDVGALLWQGVGRGPASRVKAGQPCEGAEGWTHVGLGSPHALHVGVLHARDRPQLDERIFQIGAEQVLLDLENGDNVPDRPDVAGPLGQLPSPTGNQHGINLRAQRAVQLDETIDDPQVERGRDRPVQDVARKSLVHRADGGRMRDGFLVVVRVFGTGGGLK